MPPDVDAVDAHAASDGTPTPGPEGAEHAAPAPAAKAPHFDESVRRIGKAGKATFASSIDTGRALRKLVAADFALARSATGRAAAWLAAAIVFGATSSLLLMGAVVALMRVTFELSWLGSILVAALVSLVATGVAGWRAALFFDLAGMHASRRQLARIGIGDEDGDEPEPGCEEVAAARAAAAAARAQSR